MKIFQNGYNHAGTSSLYEALSFLGYKTIHSNIDRILLTDLAEENTKRGRSPFYPYDSTYDAFIGYNYERNFPAVYSTYGSNAKFIITIRDDESCWDSTIGFYIRRHGIDYSNDDKYIKEFLVRKHCLKEHIEEFKDNPNFLVMNICAGDGWDKLCPFLDKPIPNIDFPHANSAKKDLRSTEEHIQRFKSSIEQDKDVIKKLIHNL